MEFVFFLCVFFSDGCTFLVKQNLENCIDFNFLPIYKGFIPIVEY